MTELEEAVARAVGRGLEGAALLGRDGNVFAHGGALDADDLRAIAAFVAQSLRGDELADGLFEGDLMPFELAGRSALLGVAARSVFVVALAPSAQGKEVKLLRESVARFITAMLDLVTPSPAGPPPPSNGPGSPSGPAQLPVIELGVTPGVRRGKA